MGDRKVKYFSIMIATLIVSGVTRVLYSYTYKMIFHGIEFRLWDEYIKACILSVIVLILTYVYPYLRYFQMRQVRYIVFNIKVSMFSKLTKLNMQYFEEHHSADVLKRLNQDANSLKDTYFSRVFRVLFIAFNGFVSILSMIIYSWKLAAVSILFSLISVAISIYMNKLIKKLSKEIQGKIGKLSEGLSDILQGFLMIKMFSGAHIVMDSYLDENNKVKTSMVHRTRVLSMLEMLTFLIGMLGNIGTIIVGVFLVLRGELDYGTVMAIITLQMSVSAMFQYMGGALADYTASLAEAQRVFDFLELDEVETHGLQENVLEPKREDGIHMENVTFSYKGRNKVLDSFNMNVDDGEKVMIVGESGCGKSTILKLLLRFYDKTQGRIHIYGHEISDYSLEQLHDMITYVPQGNYLFAGTIKDNISYGNSNANDSEIEKAAELAYAKEFIDEFPDGFNTELSLGGKNLSGGQRQRIAIARAFLKSSPILLMDEPSSALDVESEKKINLALSKLMEEKIVILVTHRTSSFADFDRVIQIKDELMLDV